MVNLPLPASLEERFTHRELDCFLGVRDRDDLEKNILVDKTAGDEFTIFWKAVVETEVETFPCF